MVAYLKQWENVELFSLLDTSTTNTNFQQQGGFSA
jgi:hypothetical protein